MISSNMLLGCSTFFFPTRTAQILYRNRFCLKKTTRITIRSPPIMPRAMYASGTEKHCFSVPDAHKQETVGLGQSDDVCSSTSSAYVFPGEPVFLSGGPGRNFSRALVQEKVLSRFSFSCILWASFLVVLFFPLRYIWIGRVSEFVLEGDSDMLFDSGQLFLSPGRGNFYGHPPWLSDCKTIFVNLGANRGVVSICIFQVVVGLVGTRL